jgi:hypothetical protein
VKTREGREQEIINPSCVMYVHRREGGVAVVSRIGRVIASYLDRRGLLPGLAFYFPPLVECETKKTGFSLLISQARRIFTDCRRTTSTSQIHSIFTRQSATACSHHPAKSRSISDQCVRDYQPDRSCQTNLQNVSGIWKSDMSGYRKLLPWPGLDQGVTTRFSKEGGRECQLVLYALPHIVRHSSRTSSYSLHACDQRKGPRLPKSLQDVRQL